MVAPIESEVPTELLVDEDELWGDIEFNPYTCSMKGLDDEIKKAYNEMCSNIIGAWKRHCEYVSVKEYRMSK